MSAVVEHSKEYWEKKAVEYCAKCKHVGKTYNRGICETCSAAFWRGVEAGLDKAGQMLKKIKVDSGIDEPVAFEDYPCGDCKYGKEDEDHDQCAVCMFISRDDKKPTEWKLREDNGHGED